MNVRHVIGDTLAEEIDAAAAAAPVVARHLGDERLRAQRGAHALEHGLPTAAHATTP